MKGIYVGAFVAFLFLIGSVTHAELIAHWSMNEDSGKGGRGIVGKLATPWGQIRSSKWK